MQFQPLSCALQFFKDSVPTSSEAHGDDNHTVKMSLNRTGTMTL